jgi:hypothetical protein
VRVASGSGRVTSKAHVSRKEIGGRAALQLPRPRPRQRDGVFAAAAAARLEASLPSGRRIMPRNESASPSSTACPAIGVRQEPSSTARNARSQASADAGVGMIDLRQQFARARIVGARLDRDRALPDRRQEFCAVEQRRRLVGKPSRFSPPAPAASRRPRRLELAQPRLDIAAQRHDRRQSGRSRFTIACRRSDAVPTTAPCGRSRRLAPCG